MNMQHKDPLVLTRDCDAILIPAGTQISLKKDSVVFVVQALGGNYTVNVNGNLAQVAARDADALGFETNDADSCRQDSTDDGVLSEELIWQQLKTCYDPEIPVNIVDLGLVYDCTINKQEDGNHVDIKMTLTAPGCGMGEFLAADVQYKVASVPNVSTVNVELVFDPPWSMEMMSESARLELGMY
jgi:probable FeS assembly SUF system protein SufT